MKLAEIPSLRKASASEKIALIDELWASIPRDTLRTPKSHLDELSRREHLVKLDPQRALTPIEARRRIRANTGL